MRWQCGRVHAQPNIPCWECFLYIFYTRDKELRIEKQVLYRRREDGFFLVCIFTRAKRSRKVVEIKWDMSDAPDVDVDICCGKNT